MYVMAPLRRDASAPDHLGGPLLAEPVDQEDRFVPELSQDIDDWLFGNRPKIAKHYLDAGFSSHLHVRLRFPEGDTQDFCAFFSRPLEALRWRDAGDVYRVTLLPRVRLTASKYEFPSGYPDDYHRQKTMFVGIIHLTENTEEVLIDAFRLVVRLARLDQVSCGVGDALYASAPTGKFEILRRITDRELMSARAGLVVCDNELADEMIQARPQLVDDFPDDYREPSRRLWSDYAYDVLSRVIIGFTDSTVSVTVDKGVDFRIEIIMCSLAR